MQYTKRVFNIGVQLVDLYKSVSLWDPSVHFPFCGTRCYSILMLTVWANDSKRTVVRPYTLSCVMSNKWSLDIHILCKSFVVLAHINHSSSLHCTENFDLVVTLVLWSVLKLSAVDSSLPFLSFMTFLPCWPLHRLWRLFTCFLVTNLPLYRSIFDNRKFWWCRSEQLDVKTFGLECGENPGCHFLPLEVPLVTRDRP